MGKFHYKCLSRKISMGRCSPPNHSSALKRIPGDFKLEVIRAISKMSVASRRVYLGGCVHFIII